MLAGRVAVKAARRGESSDETPSRANVQLRVFPGAAASRSAFDGFDVMAALGEIRTGSGMTVPEREHSAEWLRDVVIYSLHRFTKASAAALAALTGVEIESAYEAAGRLGASRMTHPGWERLPWTLEWRLMWWLRAAPHRP